MDTWPKVVIMLKTWQGPTPEIAAERLSRAAEVFRSIEKNLDYPNWAWHIADDGSDTGYVEQFLDRMGTRPYIYTSSGANGDIGCNLNTGLRVAFQQADLVMNWSDDICLTKPLDLRPAVELLQSNAAVGYAVLRSAHPSLRLIPMADGWNEIDKDSPNRFLITTSLNLMHRRAWDFYGPYPEGLRIDIMQMEMAWRYRHFKDGLKIVIHDDLVDVKGLINYRAHSTWSWRVYDKEEQKAWYRYRSYAGRRVQA